jgi:hypothetical protein
MVQIDPNLGRVEPLSSPLFQALVDRLGHLKHIQFLAAKDWLQLVVSQDFPFVLWILKSVLLECAPKSFLSLHCGVAVRYRQSWPDPLKAALVS